MKLYDYLLENEILPIEFARKVGMQVNSIYRIIGGLSPTLNNAHRIVKATDGQVDYEDMLRLVPRKKKETVEEPYLNGEEVLDG